jgi:hypothetical protein
VVDESTGDVYVGNNFNGGQSVSSSNLLEWDELNNVEQVMIPSPTIGGRYSIHVIARTIARPTFIGATQSYSLVVSGGNYEVPLTECQGRDICPNQCSGHGTCSTNGLCICDPKWSMVSPLHRATIDPSNHSILILSWPSKK